MKTQGLLLDLQGVLYQDGSLIKGAAEALQALQGAGLEVRFLTNTTTKPQRLIAERLMEYGLQVSLKDVFSPAIAARGYLVSQNLESLFLASEPELLEDFEGFPQEVETPDAVIMGDMHTRFDWLMLDRIFVMVQHGSRLIALHKNRYCRRDGHIALDLGPFVAAIEYATGTDAIVMGKPDQGFFQMALQDMGLLPADVVMVGDDPFSDIGGAKAAGIRAVQVKTGKYNPSLAGEAPEADETIASIADLPALLGL